MREAHLLWFCVCEWRFYCRNDACAPCMPLASNTFDSPHLCTKPHVSKTSEQPTVIQEQIVELERGISHTQASVTRAHEIQRQLQGQRIHLKQRVNTCTAAIDAILRLSKLLPDTAPVMDPPHQGSCFEYLSLIHI